MYLATKILAINHDYLMVAKLSSDWDARVWKSMDGAFGNFYGNIENITWHILYTLLVYAAFTSQLEFHG